ncbi:tropinone reductase homolog At5g06060-like [Olea europaea var. sylvestris]|uniref:tropinone reductase homolog At5g06060-like n=1 Tax=Olea europaea var. sylvestris TaxID=158386 RepID=UPI000C1D72FE|nr:tropinone reductase homolog At5g06060-like [Olea europaea var. sylvestris]
MGRTEQNFKIVLFQLTTLVTGGTCGIGSLFVEELSEMGAIVHTCSRNEAELHQRLQEWNAKGFKVSGSVCDASSRDQRTELIEKVSSIFNGKLNILINNVGSNIRMLTVDYSVEEYSYLLATNFDAVFISSVAALIDISSGSIYGVTKGAINQLTRNLACEWAKEGIRVNCVAPWYIKISLVEHLICVYLGHDHYRSEFGELPRNILTCSLF